jgi:hypothetical protein
MALARRVATGAHPGYALAVCGEALRIEIEATRVFSARAAVDCDLVRKKAERSWIAATAVLASCAVQLDRLRLGVVALAAARTKARDEERNEKELRCDAKLLMHEEEVRAAHGFLPWSFLAIAGSNDPGTSFALRRSRTRHAEREHPGDREDLGSFSARAGRRCFLRPTVLVGPAGFWHRWHNDGSDDGRVGDSSAGWFEWAAETGLDVDRASTSRDSTLIQLRPDRVSAGNMSFKIGSKATTRDHGGRITMNPWLLSSPSARPSP